MMLMATAILIMWDHEDAMILGHRHLAVIAALENAIKSGTSFGAPTPLETELANLVIEFVPSVEMVRMVNSGTEAAMRYFASCPRLYWSGYYH